MFYDILHPKVYGVATLSMLMQSHFHQNVMNEQDLNQIEHIHNILGMLLTKLTNAVLITCS